MRQSKPIKPRNIDPLAVELMTGLEAHPNARHFVLGGYFALKHYCDYRPTHDVDAWWDSQAGELQRQEARHSLEQVMQAMARRHGLELNTRRFGDTESRELVRAGDKIFSFQISARTVQLEPYLDSPWPPLQIESLADNVGSKMNALVQRGAPRDFVDVRQLAEAGLVGPAECWELWQRKNPDLTVDAARAEVARHVHELELRRPLNAITDPAERVRAAATRLWFKEHFLSLPSQ